MITNSISDKVAKILRSPFSLLLLLVGVSSTGKAQQSPQTNEKPGIWRMTKQFYEVINNRMKLNEQVFFEFNELKQLTRQINYTTDSFGIATKKQQVVYHYDRKGHHLGTSRFNGDNVLVWKEEFFFDPQGHKIRAEITDYTTGRIPKTSFSLYDYDINGNQSRVADFDQQGVQVREKGWTYNEFGDIESSYMWDYILVDGNPEKRQVSAENKYDKAGNLIKSTIEKKEKGKSFKEVRLFENNFVSEWLKYKDGELVSRYKSNTMNALPTEMPTENPQGLEPPIPTQEEFMQQNVFQTEWANSFEFDQHGNTVSTSKKSAAGDLVSVFKFEYDERQNLARTLKQYADINLVEEVLMEYDDYDNLETETLLVNGETVSKVVYLYDYFTK